MNEWNINEWSISHQELIKMEREKKRRKCTIVEKMLKSTINQHS